MSSYDVPSQPTFPAPLMKGYIKIKVQIPNRYHTVPSCMEICANITVTRNHL